MHDQLSQWEESMAQPMRGEYENAWQMHDPLGQWEESMARPMRGEYENAWQMHDPLGQLEESMLGQWEECMRYYLSHSSIVAHYPNNSIVLLGILSRSL